MNLVYFPKYNLMMAKAVRIMALLIKTTDNTLEVLTVVKVPKEVSRLT